ncbi:PaaI family thioesterase [bacterium]
MNNTRLPNYPHCFVCGKENHHGLALSFEKQQDKVVTLFESKPWMVGFKDVIHGGILSTLLDEAVIWAAYAVTGRFGATAELVVRFKKPFLAGESCLIEGWMESSDSRIWSAAAQAVHEQKGVLAMAHAKIFPFSGNKQKEFSKYLNFE